MRPARNVQNCVRNNYESTYCKVSIHEFTHGYGIVHVHKFIHIRTCICIHTHETVNETITHIIGSVQRLLCTHMLRAHAHTNAHRKRLHQICQSTAACGRPARSQSLNRTPICACVYMYMHACMLVCPRTCVPAWGVACVSLCMRSSLCACTHALFVFMVFWKTNFKSFWPLFYLFSMCFPYHL